MFRISTLEPFQDHQDPRTNAPWKVLKMDEDGLSHELFNIKDALFHLTYRCLQSLPALSHKRQAFAASQELHLKLSKQDQIHSCLSIAIVSHLCDISTGEACFRAFCLRTLYRWQIKVQAIGISFELVFHWNFPKSF